MTAKIDPTRLYTALLNTGLQQKDNPLYQVIYNLIGNLVDLNNQINAINIVVNPALGPQGIQGLQGLQGIQGFPGNDGEDGETIILLR